MSRFIMMRKPILLSWLLLHFVYDVAGVFLHEPSHVVMQPSEELDGADFGFSIAYQKSTPPSLVIGSPHADFIGRVYRCPVENVNRKTQCPNLNMQFDSLTTIANDTNKEKERFCLGASIAATPDYFVTCAPLWRTKVLNYAAKLLYDTAFGTCFVYYNDTTTYRYEGLAEQHSSRNRVEIDAMLGGIGWSILLDHDQDMMLIGKPALKGDIHYTYLPNPKAVVKKSLTFSFGKKTTTKKLNIQKIKNTFMHNLHNNNAGFTLTSGNFFSDTNETVYAFYFLKRKAVGQVLFLENKFRTLILKQHNNAIVAISSPVSGSLFGTVLHGADVTRDGFADLLIGAPALTERVDDSTFDVGALYFFLGGDVQNLNVKHRRRVLLGSKDGARFGSAIATNDIDADGYPEIFVSAPYEDLGVGALYILSGFEIHDTLIKPGVYKEVHLNELRSKQTIKLDNFRSFGFSLQVVPDVDDNGCDEIAVGSPKNASVIMFRCVPAITPNVTLKLVDKVVREYDKNFTVEVCVSLSFQPKPSTISTTFSVQSKVFGNGAEIINPTLILDLSSKEKEQCENVIVKLNYNDAGFYNFTSQLRTNIDEQLKQENFSSSWVTLSAHRDYVASLQITRHCSELDCTPHLEVSFMWAGSANTSDYVLGSKDTEELAVVVQNKGGNVYDACVRLRISGQVVSTDCGPYSTDAYECYLPKPLKRNDETQIKMLVNMTRSSTTNNKLHIDALLYNNCNNENATEYKKEINLHLSTDQLQVYGSSHSFKITDTQVLKAQSDNAKIDDGHEYTIINNGSINWENITVSITLPKAPYIDTEGCRVPGRNCVNESLDTMVKFVCTMDLMPHSTSKLLVVTEILIAKIEENLNNNTIEIVSEFELSLRPTSDIINDSSKSFILYQKELSVNNNMTFIVIMTLLLAIIILGVAAFILYKLGFFKRKTKQRLEQFRETVRRKSVRQSSSTNGHKTKSEDDDDGLDIEVVEESPFEEAKHSSTNSDDVKLIEKEKTT